MDPHTARKYAGITFRCDVQELPEVPVSALVIQ
jgi:hypothetical protein